MTAIEIEEAADLARRLADEVLCESSRIHDGLTSQESRLVSFVRACAPRVVSKDVLTEAVAFDRARPIGAKQVDVLLSRVRAKRPDIGAQIKTVWGEGLRWTGSRS